MNGSDERTVEWFENTRRRCIDHLRALLSIRIAQDSIRSIRGDWEERNIVTQAALHSACVIAYSRPFVGARSKAGNLFYGISKLRKAEGFDVDLHRHLLELRNKIIAHSDYDIFPSTMFTETVGDEKLPVQLGINVKAMMGIEDRTLATRYESHIGACALAIESELNSDCGELVAAILEHPETFAETHNIAEHSRELPSAEEFADLPPPEGPAAQVENPPFEEGLAGYRYSALRHQVPLLKSGKYKITVDGKEAEIEFSIGRDSQD
ncbi:hypothetical protein [Methyloligella solikamskensis]|uniref:HEPN AbiU2-like domain-containing protein n=1 Tax=Methyloligella solikamskensis TaxID=1177756 RepID=A0ABW3J7X6_9HYPH